MFERFTHAAVTPVDTCISPLRVFVPLDVGIAALGNQLRQHREQCLLVHRACCEKALYQVHVLLRHRPRSIPHKEAPAGVPIWAGASGCCRQGVRSRLALALHRADALALVLELREVLPAVVLALVLVGRRRPFRAGEPQRAADSAWKRAKLERITLHESRHTFASLMIAAGVNAKALSTYMGHANINITLDKYGHLMPGNEGEAADLLDAYLERAAEKARRAAV